MQCKNPGFVIFVVYSSQGGTSKRYAATLADRTGCDCFSLKEAEAMVGDGADVMFVGWRSGTAIVGLREAKKRFNVIAAVAVGLESVNDKELDKLKKKNEINNLFYARGGMDRDSLTFGQKVILGLVSIKMRIFDRDVESIATREIMDHGGDLSSDDQIWPAADWLIGSKGET
jgi:hypothetical protein